MTEYCQVQAYKQLLQVTQNILTQLSPQQQIIHKYLTLKKSILGKIKYPVLDRGYVNKMMIGYKNLAKNILECISEFQGEIQGEMNKLNFIKNTIRLVKDMEKETRGLSQEFSNGSQQGKNVKLMLKQELNAFKIITKEFEGKIQNMALMIQVHHKMHQIILQASDKEIKTSQKQIQYNKRLNQMEDVVDKITNIKQFINAYEITQKKVKKFNIARKSLAKVLFDF